MPRTRLAAVVMATLAIAGPRIDGPRVSAAGASGELAVACADLSSLALAGGTVVSAQLVPAGSLPGGSRGTARVLPAHCRLVATLRPAAQSSIHLEAWLPADGWNGKMVVVGNGAYGGSVPLPALVAGLRAGYAAVASDTGHTGSGAAFALTSQDQLRDFIDRAVHESAVHGKAVIAKAYGQPHARAYFNGCSTGGRQGLTAAQRYPDDFDGIVAGSPGNYTTRQAFGQVWVAQAMKADPASTVPAEKLPVIHAAVMAACDGADGVADGVLENPTTCSFDPVVLQCTAGDGATCLTAPQVAAVRQTYAGARHSRTGELLFPGFERGSELGWTRWVGDQAPDYATEFFRHVAFKDPAWHFTSLDFDRDVTRVDQLGVPIDAIEADLAPFFARRGKLLMYAGWNDPGIAPRNAVSYYTRVVEKVGAARAGEAIRLFMVPGMAHCGGGEGTSSFDMLQALDDWVQRGEAPARVLAAREQNGRVVRTRPLCPYPQVATYLGAGDADDASSFVCR